ncbi:hypothetical protein HU200_035857 [Digitaria exilis]|uniref:Uncharacterized protein n=1 Tax=Digitaria exilis TaxID=1010633 RepID=A0A835EP61_9POAL|nr:hypothetical protein HU200_035857 [Digitaria exilis]
MLRVLVQGRRRPLLIYRVELSPRPVQIQPGARAAGLAALLLKDEEGHGDNRPQALAGGGGRAHGAPSIALPFPLSVSQSPMALRPQLTTEDSVQFVLTLKSELAGERGKYDEFIAIMR